MLCFLSLVFSFGSYMPVKCLTLYFDKMYQTHLYTDGLTEELKNHTKCAGLLCNTKTHKISPAWQSQQQGHGLLTVPAEIMPGPSVVSIWGHSQQAACPGWRSCASENLCTLLPCWGTFQFSIIASKLLSGFPLPRTSKSAVCLAPSTAVLFTR